MKYSSSSPTRIQTLVQHLFQWNTGTKTCLNRTVAHYIANTKQITIQCIHCNKNTNTNIGLIWNSIPLSNLSVLVLHCSSHLQLHGQQSEFFWTNHIYVSLTLHPVANCWHGTRLTQGQHQALHCQLNHTVLRAKHLFHPCLHPQPSAGLFSAALFPCSHLGEWNGMVQSFVCIIVCHTRCLLIIKWVLVATHHLLRWCSLLGMRRRTCLYWLGWNI